MDEAALAFWRNVSLILLCLEAFILMLIPGALFFFAQKYLRRFRHWLRVPILRAYVYTLKAQDLTLRASNGVAGVPISVQMLGTRMRATAQRLVKRT